MRLSPHLPSHRWIHLLWTCLAACTSWHTVALTPAPYLGDKAREVRVVRTDSTLIILRSTSLHGDTLIGTTGGRLAKAATAREIRMPLDSVQSLAVRRFSFSKTLGLYCLLTLPVAITINANGGIGY